MNYDDIECNASLPSDTYMFVGSTRSGKSWFAEQYLNGRFVHSNKSEEITFTREETVDILDALGQLPSNVPFYGDIYMLVKGKLDEKHFVPPSDQTVFEFDQYTM